MDEELLSDVRLAVTEACSNVVVHAYPEDAPPGPLEVLATVDGGELTVVVRDHGPGIAPHPDSPGLGLGLPLIASLAESVHLGRDEQERTEVCLTFPLAAALRNGAAGGTSPGAGADADTAAEVDVDGQDEQIDPTSRT